MNTLEKDRYMIDMIILDTQTQVNRDGELEPKVVTASKFYYDQAEDGDCVCDTVDKAIQHYESHHLDEDDYDE